MLELFTEEALFDHAAAYYGELSLLSKAILACIAVFGIAALIMASISLISHIMTGAPFIATPMNLTRKIVSLADIQSGEVVYDLGCGDARFLIEANKFYGAKAVGVDVSPLVCGLAKLNVRLKRSNVHIHCANFKTYDFRDADVIFCFLVPDQMIILGEKSKELKPGCRIISRRFEIPGWEPLQHISIKHRLGSESVFIYRI